MTNKYGNLELHKVLLSAMKDVDRICRENGLKYYIHSGTLLGAVNFKGFIPWDDDVDIVMFPNDFATFQEVIENEYSNKYKLKTFDNTPEWHTKLNKLLINGTEVITTDGKKQNIFIDICVLHSMPDSRIMRFFQRKIIEIANIALHYQAGEIVPISIMSRMAMGFLGMFSMDSWGHLLDRVMAMCDKKNTEYVGIMCNTISKSPHTGRNGYDTDITKRKWHIDYIYIDFEDTQFMTISNYDDALTYWYGKEYSKPYPEEKRVTKHAVKTYSISDEVRKRAEI